jgi:hypothetical protein
VLKRILQFGLTRRPIILLFLFVFIGGGFIAFSKLNIEAYPNPAQASAWPLASRTMKDGRFSLASVSSTGQGGGKRRDIGARESPKSARRQPRQTAMRPPLAEQPWCGIPCD